MRETRKLQECIDSLSGGEVTGSLIPEAHTHGAILNMMRYVKRNGRGGMVTTFSEIWEAAGRQI